MKKTDILDDIIVKHNEGKLDYDISDRMIESIMELSLEEREILILTKSKTPIQVKEILINGYLRLNNTSYSYSDIDEIMKQSAPVYSSCKSWRGLFASMIHLDGKLSSCPATLIHRVSGYWSKMSFLLKIFPRKGAYCNKYYKKSELSEMRPRKGWQFLPCELCWRIVPYNIVASVQRSLCFVHRDMVHDNNINVSKQKNYNHPQYRKLKRLKRDHKEIVMKVVSPEEFKMYELREAGIEIKPISLPEVDDNYILSILKGSGSPYPYLQKYLRDVGYDNNPESLLRALHGKVTQSEQKITGAIMSKSYSQAMEEFYERCRTGSRPFGGLNPKSSLSSPELQNAEAWLFLMNRDRRRKYHDK